MERKSETAKALDEALNRAFQALENLLDYIDEKGLDEFRDENLKNDKNLGD